MAGIGIKLKQIYGKRSITTNLVGFGYSSAITVAPMFLVIGTIVLMQYLLEFSKVAYIQRELFACTVLYIFVFGLLSASPFNAVLSKYLSDIIYKDEYDNIMPCFYTGLLLNTGLSVLLGIPFCVREFFVGEVKLYYVFTGYCGYIALMFVFYSMLYLSVCKVYSRISWFFLIGMIVTVILSLVFAKVLYFEKGYSMLLALSIGFMVIGALEYAQIRCFFKENSGKYKEVLKYFKIYWQLVLTNFMYTLGMYMHNFVFWATDMHLVVVRSFVCMQPYDMATCLAMFTNISASVIFISRVEMHFHERYKHYSEAVIGGRGMDIANAKKRMFEQLSDELMNLVRIQFIVTVVVFFICMVIFPKVGFGGLVMQIYPCLTAGYFVLFLMYAEIIFLYYFNDLNGSLLTAVSFTASTLVLTLLATKLTPIWYGIGFFGGAIIGFTVAYFRLRYIEKNLDVHVFCKGHLLKAGEGEKPDNKVYTRAEG